MKISDIPISELIQQNDKTSKDAIITPKVTTVVVSPTEVYTAERGETITTKDGAKIFIDDDGQPQYLTASEEGLLKQFYSWVEAENFVYVRDAKNLYNKLLKLLSKISTLSIDLSKSKKKISIFKDKWFNVPSVLTDTKNYERSILCLYYWADEPRCRIYGTYSDLNIRNTAQYASFVRQYAERCLNHIFNIKRFYINNSNDKFDDLKLRQSFAKSCAHSATMALREINLFKKDTEELIARGTESLEVSTEALPAGFKEKRKKIEAYILSSLKLLDRHTDINQKYWKDKFASMSDADFDKFMHYIKEKKTNIHMFVPPLKVTLKNAELVDAAHKLGVKLMHRIWMTDPNTGMKYLTPEEYMVVQLPVRRQQQYLDEKISVPDNDKTIDGLTGQVTGDSKACAITNPEIQIMQARNLNSSLFEFVNVRGGNINSYAEFKRALEETGSVSLNSLDPSNRTRVAVMGGVLLTAMMIENNLAEV